MFILQSKKKGQVLVLMVILIAVILGLVGLALDTWQITYQKQKMQQALDISVLAGAQELALDPGNEGNAVEKTKKYGELNGLVRGDIKVYTNYQGDKNKISAEISKEVKLWFMPILGINSKIISVRAAAIVSTSYTVDPVFDYVFFSGSTVTGVHSSFANSIFDGKVHGNSYFECSGGKNTFNYDLEVVGEIKLRSDTVYKGKVVNPASIVPVPVYDINKYKSQASTTYSSSVIFSGGSLNLNGIMFVNGDISINNGCKVQGKGTIVATGSITITGGGQLNYSSSNDLIAIYSMKNITITGGNDIYSGMLYAPNGEIVLTGGNTTFYGAIVGNTIRISNGNYVFKYDSRIREIFGEKKIQTGLIE